MSLTTSSVMTHSSNTLQATPSVDTQYGSPEKPALLKHGGDGRILELDGIRATAVWMVLLSHIMGGYRDPVGALALVPGAVKQALLHGWLGVDLFFLLSGFLITGILIDSKSSPRYFRNFYTRRFLRIMPLYFAVILVWSIFYSQSARYFLLSSVFGANLSYLFGIHEPHGPGVLWSLAVEEHFYVLWPLIVLLCSRRSLLLLSTAIFVATPALRGVFAARGMNPDLIYVLSWFRFDGLAAGAILAIWVRSSAGGDLRSSRRIATALMTACALLTVVGAKFGLLGTHTTAAVALRYTQAYLAFSSIFVLAIAYRGTRWTAPLRWHFVQLSGALSYCIYLVHLSIGDGYEAVLASRGIVPSQYLGSGGALVARGIVIISLSFGVALLTRKFIERPCLALKDILAARPHGAFLPQPRLEVVET